MNEIERLKIQLQVTMRSMNSAVELADYETANMLAQQLELNTKQIMLCQKQAIEEAQ